MLQRLKYFLRRVVLNWRSSNTISIESPGSNHQFLVFHLRGVPLVVPGGCYTLMRTSLESKPTGRLNLGALSAVGNSMVNEIFHRLADVVTMEIHSDSIMIRLTDEFAWEFLLSDVVGIMREFHPRGRVPVRLWQSLYPLATNWHESLLAETFGEMSVPEINDRLKRRVVKRVARYPSGEYVSSSELLQALRWRDFIWRSGEVYALLVLLAADGQLEQFPAEHDNLYGIPV